MPVKHELVSIHLTNNNRQNFQPLALCITCIGRKRVVSHLTAVNNGVVTVSLSNNELVRLELWIRYAVSFDLLYSVGRVWDK